MSVARHTALLTGIPRSGTTLCCRLLNQCTDTLALVEPMQVQSFDPQQGEGAACAQIERFSQDIRRKVAQGRAVPSLQARGALAENVIADAAGDDGLRRPMVVQGEVLVDRPLSDDFALVIKHNALFTALLPRLQTIFPVYAVIRNPLLVLASWNSVDLPVYHGRVPAGERYAPQLGECLAAEPDRLQRQLKVLDWFFRTFDQQVPSGRLIRYESLVQGLHTPLPDMAAAGGWGGLSNIERDQAQRYPSALLTQLADRLLASDGAYWQYYDKDAVEALLP